VAGKLDGKYPLCRHHLQAAAADELVRDYLRLAGEVDRRAEALRAKTGRDRAEWLEERRQAVRDGWGR
jgi:hypothetical protein